MRSGLQGTINIEAPVGTAVSGRSIGRAVLSAIDIHAANAVIRSTVVSGRLGADVDIQASGGPLTVKTGIKWTINVHTTLRGAIFDVVLAANRIVFVIAKTGRERLNRVLEG